MERVISACVQVKYNHNFIHTDKKHHDEIFADICASVHDGQDGGEDDSNLLLVDRLNILNIIITNIIITIIIIIRSLVSAHCSPNPTYAVFTKQHSSMPLAMKVVFLEGKSLPITLYVHISFPM